MEEQHEEVSSQQIEAEYETKGVKPLENAGSLWSQVSVDTTIGLPFFCSRPLVGRYNLLRKRLPSQGSAYLETSGDLIMSLVYALGTLTFEAYDEPDIVGFNEVTVSGTRLKHLNYEMMCKGVEGVLKIHLESAKNVPNYDFLGGKSDPYVLFSTGWSQTASETQVDQDNPVWNSDHYLLLRKPGAVQRNMEDLKIGLYNSNSVRGKNEERTFRYTFRKDDLLGSGSVKIADFKQPGIHRKELTLDLGRNRFKTKPILIFTVQFLSIHDACCEWNKEKGSEAWHPSDRDTANNSKANPSSASRWRELCKECSAEYLDMKPVAFINGVNTGTQAWIHVNKGEKVVAVAFRGTETKRLKDVLTDMNIVPSQFTWHRLPKCDLNLSSAWEQKRARVHSGFLHAYQSVWLPILSIVHQITSWSKAWTVCITGHSLGGALATLCAFEFANRMDGNGLSPHIIMMNFGAPRVGNRGFVDAYQTSVPESYRVVNPLDPVRRVPRIFSHVHHEILFQQNGNIILDNKESMKSCLNDDDTEETATSRNTTGSKRVRKRDLIKTLGFQGHLETYYYDIVSYAAQSWKSSSSGDAENGFDWSTSMDIAGVSLHLEDWSDIPTNGNPTAAE